MLCGKSGQFKTTSIHKLAAILISLCLWQLSQDVPSVTDGLQNWRQPPAPGCPLQCGFPATTPTSTGGGHFSPFIWACRMKPHFGGPCTQLLAVWGTVWLLGMTWARLLEAGNPVERGPAVPGCQGGQLCTCLRRKALLGHWSFSGVTAAVPRKLNWLLSLQLLYQLTQVQEQSPPPPLRSALPCQLACLLG